jgi:hypothetical protein
MATTTTTSRRPLLTAALMLLVFVLVLTTGCNAVGNLFGGGGGGGGRDLWSDVPKMDGMQGADLGLPLPARLAIQAAFQGNIDYMSFTTNSSTADVQAFYGDTDRMSQAGWSAQELGCVGDPQGGGAICFFTKEQDGKQEGLAIVVAAGENSGPTQVFYVRIDLSALETPSAG